MKTMFTTALLLFSTAVSAQPYVFVGFGTDSAFGIGGGYSFTRHLGVETSFFRSQDEATKFTGVGLAALGTLPIGERAALLARVGTYRVEATLEGQPPAGLATVTGTPGGTASSATETVLGYALGGSYTLARDFSLRVMYERYEDRGALDSVDFVTGALVYRF
jgi:hypothetical protein